MSAAPISVSVEVQYALRAPELPSREQLQRWVGAALEGSRRAGSELVVRLVDAEESARLNQRFRGKAGPTNVLSFPFEPPAGVPLDLLGDLVVCAPVVKREAAEQNKAPEAHFAHMVVHGTLHLLGHDHLGREEAEAMETLEIAILGRLGYPNPYE